MLAAAISVLFLCACGTAGSIHQTDVSRIADIMYWLPVPAAAADGSVYLREVAVGTGQAAGPDVLLGHGNGVWAVGTGSSKPPSSRRVLLQDSSARVYNLVATLSQSGAAWSWSRPGPPVAVIDALGNVYEGGDGNVVARRPDGSLQSYQLPALPSGTSTVDGKPIKVVGNSGTSHVAALVAGTGQVFALIDNSTSAMVVELTSMHAATLSTYGFIQGAALGPDGKLYIVAYDPTRSVNDYQLIAVDAVSLAISATIDTGINPYSANVYDLTVAATQSALYLYVAQAHNYSQTPPSPFVARSRLFELASGANSLRTVVLPDNLGLSLAVGSDGRLYIYGGPGMNVVTSYDPPTGVAAPMPELSTPPGSYVRAVFV
jgi:hypothetical protein